jgi:hypothetical protein
MGLHGEVCRPRAVAFPLSFFQGIFELTNGGGLFGKHLFASFIRCLIISISAKEFQSKACKAIWDFNGTVHLFSSQPVPIRHRCLRDLPAHPRRPLRRRLAPWAHRLRARPCTARQVERTRAGANSRAPGRGAARGVPARTRGCARRAGPRRGDTREGQEGGCTDGASS